MPSIGNGDKNWAPSKTTRSMSGLTNSGRPGSGKNRFRLGARITLPLVANFCYLFSKWVCFAVDLLLRILEALAQHPSVDATTIAYSRWPFG
jgi:hypothetical protein